MFHGFALIFAFVSVIHAEGGGFGIFESAASGISLIVDSMRSSSWWCALAHSLMPRYCFACFCDVEGGLLVLIVVRVGWGGWYARQAMVLCREGSLRRSQG